MIERSSSLEAFANALAQAIGGLYKTELIHPEPLGRPIGGEMPTRKACPGSTTTPAGTYRLWPPAWAQASYHRLLDLSGLRSRGLTQAIGHSDILEGSVKRCSGNVFPYESR